jgi:4-alpha-glucanotransferase
MSFHDYDAALHRALDLCGVQPDYWDIFGHQRFATHETKVAILGALGMDCSSQQSLEQSIDSRVLAVVSRVLPPCVVTGAAGAIDVHISAENHCDRLHTEVHWEDGGVTVSEIPLWNLARTGEIDAGYRRWVRYSLPLSTLCQGDVRLGYHRVTARLCEQTSEMWLIGTPERAWIPPKLENGGKSAGLGVQLYGIRNQRNWGCGDFSDLADVAKWAAALGASFIALNPLHAIHNRRPFNTSPYLPFSLLYRNFLYLDVEQLPEVLQCERLRRLLQTAEVQAELAFLRTSDLVEYERVAALKLRFLRYAFVYGERHGLIDREALRRWIESEGDGLDRFATYCALDEHLHHRHPDWWIFPQWPEEYRDAGSPAVAAFRRRHARNIEFYCYLQWRIDGQAAAAQKAVRDAGVSIGLYHDLPLATDRYGCELWGHGEYYVSGCRVGSPPDDFSPKGQDWGFPPPHREHHRASGYRHFVATIRAAVRHGGALRIDHVMRLFRLYWIPDAMDASCGAYVRDNWEDLIRILALESVRSLFFIVGEDLGTVEPWVRDALARFRILSYRLLYFERAEWGRFKRPWEYPQQALVSTTTHDLATLAGFWNGADIEARRNAGVLDEPDYHHSKAGRENDKERLVEGLREIGALPDGDYRQWSDQVRQACLRYLAQSPSMLLAINHEDLTGEPLQQNLPGTTGQYPNWSRKMTTSPAEMATSEATASARRLLEQTGRV